jgi:hypothetical protein
MSFVIAGLYTTSNMTGGLAVDRRLTGRVKPACAGRVDITTCVCCVREFGHIILCCGSEFGCSVLCCVSEFGCSVLCCVSEFGHII